MGPAIRLALIPWRGHNVRFGDEGSGSFVSLPVIFAAAAPHQPTIHITPKLAIIIVAVGAIAVVARSLEARDRQRRRQARRERQREYRRYLRSDGWRQRRNAAVDRASGRCQDCGARRDLDVHHLTYERKGAELPDDLRALCRQCHKARHRGDRTTLDWIALSILRWFRTRRDRRDAVGVD